MTRRLLLAIVLVTATGAFGLPIGDYIATLERIDAQLGAGQLQSAQSEAATLAGARIVWPKGTFTADASLLAMIAEAPRAEGPHRMRLTATIAELRRTTGMSGTQADRKLLEQIAAEQEPPELPKGGVVPTKFRRDVPLLERVAESIANAIEWIGKKLRRLYRWIVDLLPRQRVEPGGGTPGLHWMVWAVVGAILLVILYLAVDVIRRSRAATPESVETGTPIGSRQDEDPLSRGAMEWERYAADLANGGRYREAIRAWYHAVLVTCYAAAILHFRKGRTNWEYIASLAPSVPWRAAFIELTRRFEQEWYGSLHSTDDAYEDCSTRARSILDALRDEMRGAA